jgi:hypothetical protein
MKPEHPRDVKQDAPRPGSRWVHRDPPAVKLKAVSAQPINEFRALLRSLPLRPPAREGRTHGARLTQKVQALCRHDDAAWQPTEVAGLEVREVGLERPGRGVIVIRQRVAVWSRARGKPTLRLEVRGAEARQ